ncbi:desmocollin 2-like protein [Chaetodon auriga]|uniref:desmocollin 2-like protein n=1 Tax=Chaetodon auriga TaxID=39042 RepID=UPI004032C9D2
MANVLIISIYLLSVLSRVDSCFQANTLSVNVSQTIPAGRQVIKVIGCKSVRLVVSDPLFMVERTGEVVALTPVQVAADGRTFSVRAVGESGVEGEMEVHLVRSATQGREHTGQKVLKRTKRRWSPPDFHILENDSGPYPKDIETIVSDSEAEHKVYYTLTGPGYSQPPDDIFSFNQNTGMLSVRKAIDREQFPVFQLTTRVFDIHTKLPTDDPLPFKVIIDDVNDNAPTFTGPLQFSVPEHSNPGTVVGKVNATDRDEEGTLHVKIKYSLLTGSDLFAINPETGVLTTAGASSSLDREVKDKYMIVVQIKDIDGAQNGLFNTGTATISLTDINDNPPTFTKTAYTVSVTENEKDKLILRIPVEDKDLVNTPNWVSKFVIAKGNENGNFRIDTDPKTNEGLLYVTKPIDYEKTKNIKLEIVARNEADLKGTQAQYVSIPVDVAVTNVDEGPQFAAQTVRFTVKENVPNGTLIGTYAAVDPETDSSKGINYYKVTDPASWINVDRNTGELKVANTIDRESEFVQDGIYNITVKAVDASSKTGTGTVLIMVEDVNDNVPTVPTSELVLCEKEGELGSVLVVAEDNDQSPFSAPFSFSLPHDNDGKWSVTRYNDTAATLKQIKVLPTGIHNVPIDVTDLQGFGRKQTVKVRICQCRNGACLAKQSSVSLGALALLAMLLPLALLLLLCLLLAFFCVTKREKMEIDAGDSGGILLKSNTEAPGEEVDSSLITVPVGGIEQAVKGSVKGSMMSPGWPGNKSGSTIGVQSTHENGIYKSGVVTSDMQEYYSGQYDSQYGAQQFNTQLVGSGMDFDSRYLAQDSALLHNWQTNGRYLQQKLAFMGAEEDGRYADDIIHAYGFEGAGSVAGSIGCCSDNGDNNDLSFLNTLGPKFKNLAHVCRKT